MADHPGNAAFVELLRAARVIIDLPRAEFDDLVAAGEVLLQERLRVWTLPGDMTADLGRLLQIFGRRATVGVRDVWHADELASAARVGAQFALVPVTDADLVAIAHPMPVVLGALTPTEVARALQAGAAAVQVIPSDALGSLYARALPALLPGAPLIASGRLERFQADMWLEAGALAVRPFGAVDAVHLSDPDLSELRRRCQIYDFRG